MQIRKPFPAAELWLPVYKPKPSVLVLLSVPGWDVLQPTEYTYDVMIYTYMYMHTHCLYVYVYRHICTKCIYRYIHI